MTTATIEELTTRVRAILADSELRDAISDVRIEPVLSADDWEVLRVYLQMIDPKLIDVKSGNRLIRAIVRSLLQIDDRFPSVRFAEAA